MRVAVIGATGVVGQTILQILDERDIAVDTLLAYASRDHDTPITFRAAPVAVYAASVDRLCADRPDVVFFASSDDASAEMAQALAANGAIVIDNSATFRLDPHVPLIVPEVNATAIEVADRIFPVANCTAIVLCVALAPIERAVGLASVRVATYQAVSGAGRAGLERLADEEAAAHGGPAASAGSTFAAPIFRNVVPQIGGFDGAGDTGEEQKVAAETRKMLGRPDLHIAATTVRVPVRQAHSESVFFETQRATSQAELAAALGSAPGVVFHPRGIVTPLDVEGTDLVHVARLRPEADSAVLWQMWVVGDQLRKGAATNAVQIFETLVARGFFAAAARRAQVTPTAPVDHAAPTAPADHAAPTAPVDHAAPTPPADHAAPTPPADQATLAAPSDNAIPAARADQASLAVLAEQGTLAAPSDNATLAVPSDQASLAASTDQATPASPADRAAAVVV